MSEEVVLDRARRADVQSLQATSPTITAAFLRDSCASWPEPLDALGPVTETDDGAYVT